MINILLLEDLPEIRAWLSSLVVQVFPDAQIAEAARVHDALGLVSAMPSGSKMRAWRKSPKRWPLRTSTSRAITSVATEYSHPVPGWKANGRSASATRAATRSAALAAAMPAS